MDSYCYLCLVPVMLSCLFCAAMLSPAGKGLASWLSCVLSMWCPRSGVVLDCIDF